MSIPRRSFIGMGGGLTAAALGLSACGNNTGREPQGGTSPSGSGSSGPKPALSQWYHEYGEEGVEDAVNRYAKAYPDADISVKWNPGEYKTLVSAALLTNDVPDIFEYENGPTFDMIKAGQVLDLTDVLGDARSQFPEGVLAPMTYEGKVWAIPQTVDMQMLYYRKSVLEAAGVTPPKTFDELIDAARTVQTKKMGGFFAGNDGGGGVLGNLLIWAAGFDQLNEAGDGIGFDDPAMLAGLSQFASFTKDKGLVESASTDWYDAAPFINGETAMQWTGLWVLPQVQEALGEDFGVLPFPSIGGAGRQAVATGAFGACVAAKGKDPEAAKAFVKWLWVDQEEDQIDFSNSYGTHIPAKTALAPKADKLASGAGADAAKFVAEMGHSSSLLWTPATSQAYSTAVTNIVKKGAAPAAEIKKVADKAKAEIARANG